jgi:hypothetical protein
MGNQRHLAALKQGLSVPAVRDEDIKWYVDRILRGRRMKCCRTEGAERFALFVGAAVLANNLMIIGAKANHPDAATKPNDNSPADW